MKNNIFFTSDHHFGHKLMLKSRPFDNTYEMDEVLIQNWNSVIGKSDTVYYLGDFSFKSYKHTLTILERLNGNIIYIKGNHDKPIQRIMNGKLTKKIIEYYPYGYEFKPTNDISITLNHYCFKTWNKSHWGSWHLYGHSHGNLTDTTGKKRHDVGVDNNNLFPISLDEVAEIMKDKNYTPFDA